ncbi:hypothetical protein [uncultured Psychroserpens sp.]|uniref:hypothetical protein n=1 Tax=uncultured Psychroserpens sp. TaxID=255436 RepID=UPI0026017AD5|nr:hypothetical protein [uncultured Psychroserpens sp.]
MKKTVLFFLFVTLVLTSCIKTQKSNELKKRPISEYKYAFSQIALANYFPETHIEVRTDSIISNTFKVHIKNYSIKDEYITVTKSNSNNKIKLLYHRVFESEISVAVASKDIFKTAISAQEFKDPLQKTFWDKATLQHVWVNQEVSNNKYLNIGISFINVENNAYKLYELTLDPKGEQHLILIEEHS